MMANISTTGEAQGKLHNNNYRGALVHGTVYTHQAGRGSEHGISEQLLKGRIQSTSDISMTILPRAGIECSTVDTIICRFFKNLHARYTLHIHIYYIPVYSGTSYNTQYVLIHNTQSHTLYIAYNYNNYMCMSIPDSPDHSESSQRSYRTKHSQNSKNPGIKDPDVLYDERDQKVNQTGQHNGEV